MTDPTPSPELLAAADEVEIVFLDSRQMGGVDYAETAKNIAAFATAMVERERISCREKVAQAMMAASIATGHGDTIDDLLRELMAAVKRERNAAIEECARLVDAHPDEHEDSEDLELFRGCCEVLTSRIRALKGVP